MRATFKVSLPILGLLFGFCLLVSMCKASTTAFVEIESNFVCQISEWQTIRLTSQRKFNYSTLNISSLQNFSSFWAHHKEAFKKTTEEQLFLGGKYAPNCTTFCACKGNITAYAPSNNSVIWWHNTSISFPVVIPSIGAQLLGVRFVVVNANDLSYELQVYLRPTDTTHGNVSFNLKYCWIDEDGYGFGFTTICPTYTTVRLECSARVQDVYGVANSNGFICAASIPDAYSYNDYKFKIVSRGDDFTTVSQVFNISTCKSRSISRCPGVNGEKGKFQLVLISAKLSYVTAKPIQFRRIAASWENNNALEYNLSYNCSNGAKRNEVFGSTENSAIITNIKFQPAIKCLVCVQALEVRDSIISEPVCNITRLFIEAPSLPPTITCDSDTCPSSNEGEIRNVTITCKFPPKSTWNGALTRLLAKYRSEGSQEYKQVSGFNPSSCHSRLPGLSRKTTYFVTLQACNSKGCSGISTEVKIASFHEQNDGYSFNLWWIVAILFAIVVAGVVIVVVYYRRGKKSEQDAKPELPGLSPVNTYDPVEDSKDENCKGYHQLPLTEEQNAKPDENTAKDDVNDNISV